MKNKRNPRKGKMPKKGVTDKGFEDPFFSKIQPIIQKLETDADFYKLAATDFQAAIAPYRLSKEELAALKDKAKNVPPPKGVRGFEDPIFARDT